MLTVDRLSKRFKHHQVLTDVSFSVGAGEVVGLVGISGSGKSTVARCILGLERPDAGTIGWNGQPRSGRSARRTTRQQIQAVFQDPRSSLNPRWTIRQVLSEPLDNFYPAQTPAAREARLVELLETVTLAGDLLGRYPHELSTGQCQRVCIARALAPDPRLLVLDEPLSALDVSVQARLLELLSGLHQRTGISYLLITHDFAVISDICKRIIVLDEGRMIEAGTVEAVLERPSHPYTISLLADVLPRPMRHAERHIRQKLGKFGG